MKKFLIVLGVIFLCIIVLGAIFIGTAMVKGQALDRESKAYVDAAIPAIVSKWDERELLNRASPEFKQTVAGIDVIRQFETFSSLGNLQEYEGAQGQAGTSYIFGKGKTTSGAYAAKAQFERGRVEIQMGLIKHDGTWQIASFRIDTAKSYSPP